MGVSTEFLLGPLRCGRWLVDTNWVRGILSWLEALWPNEVGGEQRQFLGVKTTRSFQSLVAWTRCVVERQYQAVL